MARTLSEVLSYAKAQFGDTAGVQITDDDIIRATNDACTEIVSTNKVLRTSSVTSSIAGQDEYDKPPDCIRITSVKYKDTLLHGIGFDDFQNRIEHTELGGVVYWTQYGDKLVLGDAPDETGSGNIKVYYVPFPEKVHLPSDNLPVPDRYYNRICEYVMSKLYELDEDWQAQQINKQAFEQNLIAQNFEEVSNSGPFPSIIPYDL